MIELLMVMVMIGVLGAVAIPAFLDFRKEGRAAAVRVALSSVRISIKNQMQQAVLRCGVSSFNAIMPGSGGLNYYYGLWRSFTLNDITADDPGAPAYVVCLKSQIAASQRAFQSLSTSEKAHFYTAGVEGTVGTYNLPKNALAYTGDVYMSILVDDTDLTSYGGRCGVVDLYNTLGWKYHWMYQYSTADVWPGTNTPGINECNF